MTKQYDPENFLIRSEEMTDEQESISKMEQELEQMKQRVQEIK